MSRVVMNCFFGQRIMTNRFCKLLKHLTYGLYERVWFMKDENQISNQCIGHVYVKIDIHYIQKKDEEKNKWNSAYPSSFCNISDIRPLCSTGQSRAIQFREYLLISHIFWWVEKIKQITTTNKRWGKRRRKIHGQ